MRIVIISDTHGQHNDLDLPEGDLIIHAGDFCHNGGIDYLYDFMGWYAETDFEHRLLIAGNHDFMADESPERFAKLLPKNITYLNDSGVTINGIKCWGSPVQPDLIGWAFGRQRGAEMREHWDLIPTDTELLITHTPPYGILDRTTAGYEVGCEELSSKLIEIEPQLHIFGHVHASYGQEIINGTTYLNASNLHSSKGLVNPPFVFDWEANTIVE